jgi:hypothetical protein
VQPTLSDVLSVQDSVGPPIPELPQGVEEGSEGAASVHRQETRHVFINDPLGSQVVNQAEIGKGEVAAWVGESAPETGHGKSLARWSTDENVNCSGFDGPLFVLCEVAIVGCVGKAVS